MAVPDKLKDRYEIKEVLGQGGMGLVFRAWDATVKRDVALKTLRDAPTRAALQMFQKECEVLAAMSHPNLIEIFDIGEFDDGGTSKPFFVMPLIAGSTLDKLIRAASHRLTVERVVDMMSQVSRGLQAAHERGLVHRDIKPSNLYVLDDDSVKIIDFGVAHMVETGLSVGAKGTLLYMAPEQLQMKTATPASDIYSLGVVAYEALTRRRPFEGGKESEIVEAILHGTPPPVQDLNPAVPPALGRVIHKALAKQPWNRYSSAREFGETLLKGLRNEPIEFFNPSRIQPRIERASKAFEQGDLQFAGEILSDLEAEGHIDPAIAPLKRQIEHAEKQKTVTQLLQAARTRFESEEYPLSLQKIQEILQLDEGNAQALGLKASIENKLNSQKIDEWYKLAGQHMENRAWTHAREALRNVLQLRAGETRAAQLMADVDRLEQEYLRFRKEKEELYRSALEAWDSGEVSTALSKMERVIDLDHKAPETTSQERAASYQTFYNKVRSEHDAIKNSYAEAKKLLADRNFAQAHAIADEWLAKCQGHALFQALKFDIEEQQRQQVSSRIADIDRQVEAEPDLDRRVSILEQAATQYPDEPHFARQLRPMREKRDLVNSIAAKARFHEERGQFLEALGQWEILSTIYGQYPGLSFEVERVQRKKEQQSRGEAKERWTSQIDTAIHSGDYPRALELCAGAEAEFPNDAELAQLRQSAADSSARASDARKLLEKGRQLCREQWFEEGISAMRKAFELDPRSVEVKAALIETLVERARSLVETDWRAAEPIIQQALEIDPTHVQAKSLRITAQDQKRDETVTRCFTQARQFRAAGDLESALAEAEKCLAAYPLDPRLAQLRDILSKELGDARRVKARPADLEAIEQLKTQVAAAATRADAGALLGRARGIANSYPDDAEFQQIIAAMEQRIAAMPRDPGAEGIGAAAIAAVGGPPVDGSPAAPAADAAAVIAGAPVPEAAAPAAPSEGTPAAPVSLAGGPPAAPPLVEPAAVPAAGMPPAGGPPAMPPSAAPPVVPAEAPPTPGPGAPAAGMPPEAPVVAAPEIRGPAADAPAAAIPPLMPEPAVAGSSIPGMEAPPEPVSAMFSVPAMPPEAPPETAPAPAPAGILGIGQSGPPPEVPPEPPVRKPGLSPGLLWGGAAAVVVIVLFGTIAMLAPKLMKPDANAQLVTVAVRTFPPGATIKVNGKVRGTSNFQLEEKPGSYQLDAELEGYLPVSITTELKRGVSGPVELTLQALPQTVRLITDLADGKVTLDQQPARDVQDGQAAFDAVPPGKHALKLTGRAGEASIEFELIPGAVPEVRSAPAVKGLSGLVVGSFANRARIYTTLVASRAQLDGTQAGDVGPDGLELGNIAPGTHELVVSDAKTQLKKVLEMNAAPALTAFFQSDQNIGTIVVLAGEDGADVFIDGSLYRRQTSRGGQLRIQRAPREYRVRVAKPGFTDTPEEVVRVTKGEEKRVVLKLVPLPMTARLTLQGAPGAQVFIDQNPVGTVLADGTFQMSNVSPGEHIIDLRKDKQRSRSVRRSFAAGDTVALSMNDLALRGGSGTLKLTVTPSNATVTATRAGHPPQPIGSGSADLDEGSYTVTARASGYAERSEHVQIVGGQTSSMNLVLAREQRRATISGMEGWEGPAWSRDGGWFIHRGAALLLYRSPGHAGTYQFSLMLAAGGGLLRGKNLEWLAGYTDERNYILYRVDKDDLRRFRILDGKRTELPRKPHGLKLKDLLVTAQLEVKSDSLTLRLRSGEQWTVPDLVSVPGRDLTEGRFGVRIEGKDEVRLSGFGFYPKE